MSVNCISLDPIVKETACDLSFSFETRRKIIYATGNLLEQNYLLNLCGCRILNGLGKNNCVIVLILAGVNISPYFIPKEQIVLVLRLDTKLSVLQKTYWNKTTC